MEYRENVKEFFRRAPVHAFRRGDLVTCSCHGGLAIIIQLYDAEAADIPSMNMCQLFWIKYPHDGIKERIWMHTIDRLRKYKLI